MSRNSERREGLYRNPRDGLCPAHNSTSPAHLRGTMILMVLAFVLVFLILSDWYSKNKMPKHFPNGPLGLPLFGYLPIVLNGGNIRKTFGDLHKKYGKVFSVTLGANKRCVVIGDYNLLKESFGKNSFTTRPHEMNWFNQYFRYGNGAGARGIIFSQGKEWQEQRRFVMRNLRNRGYGKQLMESLIENEVEKLIESLKKDLGKPLSLSKRFNLSMVSALWYIIAGQDMKQDDPKMIEQVEHMDAVHHLMRFAGPITTFPALRHVLPEAIGWNAVKHHFKSVLEFIIAISEDHRKTFYSKSAEEDGDLIDAYLLQTNNCNDSSSSFYGNLGTKNMNIAVMDLLFAGSETTSAALEFAILLMIRYPAIQAKVHVELESIDVNGQVPGKEDAQLLHYTNAVIEEVLRFGCIVPYAVLHQTTSDYTSADGKIFIPSGTTIFPHLYHVLNDPDYFENPREFRPKHFLDKNGHFAPLEQNISFGIGKRDCLARSLARLSIFMFFAGLMKNFSFKSIESNLENLSLDGCDDFTRKPHPFEVIITAKQ